MKTKILLLSMLLSAGMAVYSTTWQISNNGASFSPATITIDSGDDVNFVLDSDHNAVEVSSATWLANDSGSNGGFQVDFGGGMVPASQLTPGTHYFVCQPHASIGMKGTIIVQGTNTATESPNASVGLKVLSNPVRDIIQIKVTETALLGSSFILSDQIGRQIITGSLVAENFSLAVGRLPAGLYFMRVEAAGTKTCKIMITK